MFNYMYTVLKCVRLTKGDAIHELLIYLNVDGVVNMNTENAALLLNHQVQ